MSLFIVVSIWNTFTPASRSTLPMRQFDECSSLLWRSMNERLCCIVLHVVVMPQAAVAGQAGGRALPAAVHGDEVDVDVDEQVALGGPLVDLDFFALVGGAEEGKVVGVFGVVVVEQAVRCERVVDPVADARGAAPLSVIRRCKASAAMMCTSSTPASAAMSSTCSITRWRMSGRFIGGSGNEMSSNAIVSFMPGRKQRG